VAEDWRYKSFREAEVFAMPEKRLGVRFLYQPPMGPAAADEGRKRDSLTTAVLAENSAERVHVHQFDRLIPPVREALEENADG
jgi:hypothetical protein